MVVDPATMQLIGTAASTILPKLMGDEEDDKLLQLLGSLNPAQNLQGLESGFNTNVGLGQQLIGGR
jgi:hypothetical protein